MNGRFEKYLERTTFISHVLNVILSGITVLDVFCIVAFAVEKVCFKIREKEQTRNGKLSKTEGHEEQRES